MAISDNTLGAPTEGLGQTVTFVADGRQGTPQTQAMQRQMLRNNPTGGGAVLTARALQIPESDAGATFKALAKLAGEALKPHIEAERTAAYVNGMQQAAQGQAIQEIVDEQPWYSRLFGSTSLVDGARAYTATAKATSIATELEADMPKLREMPPNQFSKHVTERMLGSATGDAATDMIVQQQMAQQLPGVMKQQAKNHLLFNQERLVTSIGVNADAALAKVGSSDAAYRNPANASDGDDLVANELLAIQAFVRPPEIDPTVFNKATSAAVVKAIQGGNFAAHDLVKSSGIFNTFDPQQQAAIEQAHYRASQSAKLALPLEFADTLAQFGRLQADATTSKDEIIAGARSINEQYTQLTGDRAPFLRTDQVGMEIEKLYATQDRELEAQQRKLEAASTAAAKDAAKIDQLLTVSTVMATGGYVGRESTETRANAWAVLAENTAKDPAKLASVRVQQSGLGNRDDSFAAKLQGVTAQALAGGRPDQLAAVYSDYYVPLLKAAGDNPVAAQDYFGDAGKTMAAYHKIASGRALTGMEAEVAYTETVRQGAAPKEQPAKTVAGVAKAFTSGMFAKAWHALPGDDFAVKDPEGLASTLLSKTRLDLKDEDSAELALREAERRGEITLLAGRHWTKLPTQGDFRTALSKDMTKVASDEVNRAFDYSMEFYSKRAGIDTIQAVGQISDAGGEPRIYLMGTNAAGQIVTTVMSAQEARNNWATQRDAIRPSMNAGSQEGWKGGAPVIPEGRPTIYASDAERAAYRARQKANK